MTFIDLYLQPTGITTTVQRLSPLPTIFPSRFEYTILEDVLYFWVCLRMVIFEEAMHKENSKASHSWKKGTVITFQVVVWQLQGHLRNQKCLKKLFFLTGKFNWHWFSRFVVWLTAVPASYFLLLQNRGGVHWFLNLITVQKVDNKTQYIVHPVS